jgi:hypothetical protein
MPALFRLAAPLLASASMACRTTLPPPSPSSSARPLPSAAPDAEPPHDDPAPQAEKQERRESPTHIAGALVFTAGLIMAGTWILLSVDKANARGPMPREALPLAIGGLGAMTLGGVMWTLSPATVPEGPSSIAGATVSAGAVF